ncbi:MlaD family protein [Acuticoccus mangrovi]|uniref:MCE family protein n=1 Tax=Acuticoccus mangrovi TaxID=2796142 RepID=A0A934MIZ4_9HYPH|nr:MlaD family protein [Acuticoccus mangrovi]MBJ3774089.1 MCE family protein [Acuticoccus mangrovi]
METRANYVAIGAFVLIVIAGLLGAVWWLYRSSQPGATETVRIVFPEPITGLSNGGSVLFNGIRVGEVVNLHFEPSGGDNVIAIARINPNAPIKTDTVAKLGFQGLTGVAYISLTGGSESAPSLFAEEEEDGKIPTINADTSAFTNVLDTAQSVLARLNTTLEDVNGILSTNRNNVNAVVADARTFANALAQTAPQISGLVSDVADASRALAGAAPHIASVVETANNLLSAIEPQRVETIVTNVETFTAALPGIGEKADTIVGTVNGLVTRLDDAASTIGEAVGAVRNIVDAIDAQAVSEIVTNVASTTKVFSDRATEIGTFVDDVSTIAGDVKSVTGTLASRQDKLGQSIDDASAVVAEAKDALAAAKPAIENAGKLIAAVSPESVTAIVDNVQKVTASLASETDAFRTLITSATQAAEGIDSVATLISSRDELISATLDDAAKLVENLRSASDSAPGLISSAESLLSNADAAVKAVDADAINKVVTSLTTFADALAAQSGNVETITTGLASTIGHADQIAASLAERLPLVESILNDAAATTHSVRTVADRLPAIADELQPAISNVSAALQAIDPAAISAIVNDARTFADARAAESANIQTITTGLTRTIGHADQIAASLAERLPLGESILNDAAATTHRVRPVADRLPAIADELQPAISNVSAALQAIDPAAITAIVNDARTFADALSAESANIQTITTGLTRTIGHADQIAASLAERLPLVESILNDAAATTHSVRTVADRLPAIADERQPAISNVSAALQAIDPAAITAIVNDARTFADALSAESANIQTITTGLTSTIGHADQIAASLAERLPLVESILNDAAATTHSVRTVADRLPAIADELQPAISNVSAALQAIDPAAITAIVNDARTFADALSAESANIQTITTGLTSTIGHADQIAASLAERLPMVESILNDAAATTHSVRTVADRLPAIADELQPAIANVSAALEAIDPTAITAIVDEVRRVAEAIGAQAPKFETIVANVDATASDARAIAASTRGITDELSTRREAIGGMIDDARATVSNARVASDALPGIIDTLRPGIDNAASVLSAIDPEAVRSITTSAQTFMDGLAAQREPLAELIRSANVSLGHVETITTDISGRMPEINAMIDRASAALTSIQSAADQLPGFADTLRPGLQNVADVLASIDQEAVNKIVSDVSAFTDMLAAERETVSSILTRTDSAMARVETITSSFAQRTPQIGAIIDRVEATVTSAQSFADQLPGFADTVRPGLQNLSEVLQAIDPEAISTIVTDVGRLSSTLAAEAPRVSTIISSVETTAHDVEAIAAQVRGELGTLTDGLADARAALADARAFAAQLPTLLSRIEPGLDNVSSAMQAIDPEAISTIIGNVRDVSATLYEARGDIDTVVATAGDVARRVNAVTEAIANRTDEISGIIDNVSNVSHQLVAAAPQIDTVLTSANATLTAIREAVGSVDVTAVNQIISDVRTVASTVGSRAGEIGSAIDSAVAAARDFADELGSNGEGDGAIKEIIDRARRISVNLEVASQKIDGVVDHASDLFNGPVQSLVAGVDSAATSIGDVAAAFAPRAGQIANGLSRFSQSGLDDLRALINQGRSTLGTIESAVSSFNRDPSRVIFGGSDGPRYTPQRR